MQNYRDYKVEEFAQDEFFRQSVQQPTVETNSFWQDFLIHHPEKQGVVTSAKALLKAVENVQVLPTKVQGERMWAEIQHQLQQPETADPQLKTPVYHIGFWRPWMAAAAVLLFFGLGWWFMTNSRPARSNLSLAELTDATGNQLIERSNATASPLVVHLPDKSQIVLQPQSQVRFPKRFTAAKREVYLEGEGFFEVTPNPIQPFMVYTNKVVTQVVGTSFTIKAAPNATKLSVAVRTGKVAVFTLKALQESLKTQSKIAGILLLTPNQQAIFDTRSERLTKRLVDKPVLIKQPSTSQYFMFENAPVSDVFHRLEQAYGVSIQYDTTAFSRCSLTAPLANESLFRKLDIVCQTIGATYEVWGTRVIISGKGCQNP